MEYVRIASIQDPLFKQLHNLMKDVFPEEEVLEFSLWEEPLLDPTIRVFAAVHEGEVVGVTEYRYNKELEVAMTDFTIIAKEGLGIGPFIAKKRDEDLKQLAKENGMTLKGMFAEIYDPYRAKDHSFGGVKVMDPYVRREVLSHLGYKRLDFPYVHPAWTNEGKAVQELDFCFLPFQETDSLQASFVSEFIQTYYAILSNKPAAWNEMISDLEKRDQISLLPL
ncbi:hypothetical protein JCM9140_3180 [Halalkalibacter wakoensis JCM 9140]|uniref:N-acetyltransferase domain-containing protein n=1 Tax=Halalkalibacter wakoensis JCM 9140 TaxID=1236970 RepID=W4Q5U1_9BACI|nr:hypothetical protein [Halalkalibacter wakoensis]GAE27068.1 hypothetical protein JCM9140_3180 [Halalkalibacter wakoensis JCM 9140]